MKIVVLDGYTLNPGDLSWEPLEKLGDLTVYDRTSNNLEDKDLIIKRAKDAEIIFTNKTPINKEIIDNLPKLKYIGVLATGYNIIDVEYAKEKGIVVTNTPNYGTEAVAQMTFALLLEMSNHVGEHSKAVFDGKWSESRDFCFWTKSLIELSGKTLGIIGYGSIGQNVGEIGKAFGMNILATANTPKYDLEDEKMRYVELDELLSKSDVISLHCPLFESNKGMINKDSISKMKDGVMIVNTARGGLIVEEDLANALNQGKVAGAGLDVVSVEPIKEDNPLLKAKNCIITPHIAWASMESRQRLLNIAVNNFEMYLADDPVNSL